MATNAQLGPNSANPAEVEDDSSHKVEHQLRNVRKRDWSLWGLGVFALLTVAAGFVALAVPKLIYRASEMRFDTQLLPQHLGGFFVLVVLLSLYLLDQKRRLDGTLDHLLQSLLGQLSEVRQALDPATSTASLAHLHLILPREIARSERTGSSFSLVRVSIEGLARINKNFGSMAGDHLTMVLARHLRSTFRGSDMVFKGGTGEFVVLLPNTAPDRVGPALVRLENVIEVWNRATLLEYRLETRNSVIGYREGADIRECLQELRAGSAYQPQVMTKVVPPPPASLGAIHRSEPIQQ